MEYKKRNLFMLPFVGNYVTFCRKSIAFMLPFVGNYVTFCRELCYLLSEHICIKYYTSMTYIHILIPYKVFNKDSNKFFIEYLYKGESCRKNYMVFGLSPLISVR